MLERSNQNLLCGQRCSSGGLTVELKADAIHPWRVPAPAEADRGLVGSACDPYELSDG